MDDNSYLEVHKDAWSHGQMTSKLWMCKALEKHFGQIHKKSKLGTVAPKVAIYGGWYGLLAQLILVRDNWFVSEFRSYDIDPSCQPIADAVNNAWEYTNWRFKAFTQDCNNIPWYKSGWNPDLVINTATEHFDGMVWWDNIPKGTWVALQGCDMHHSDHCMRFTSLDEFSGIYRMEKVLECKELPIQYPEWSFTRFMKIGRK